MARHAPQRSLGTAGADRITLATRRPPGVRLSIGALAILLVAGLVAAVAVSLLGATGQTRALPESTPSVSTRAGTVIYVHILGEVQSPGLYRLHDGDRVVDAVEAADGFTEVADQRGVNLARFLSDGEQILVPEQGADPVTPPPGTAGGKVNLNTATAAELETLPRVGPAMAARILTWRDTNGRFSSIDDLRGVTGIGDKTFEALRDLVTV